MKGGKGGGSDLLGELGGGPVDGLHADGLAGGVAAVGELVLGGIEGERLHHVSPRPGGGGGGGEWGEGGGVGGRGRLPMRSRRGKRHT